MPPILDLGADDQVLDPIVPRVRKLVFDLRRDVYRVALAHVVHLPVDLHPPLAAEEVVHLLGGLVFVVIPI